MTYTKAIYKLIIKNFLSFLSIFLIQSIITTSRTIFIVIALSGLFSRNYGLTELFLEIYFINNSIQKNKLISKNKFFGHYLETAKKNK